MRPFVADLHCDLLCYLSRDAQRTPYDLSVRCSIPQLKEGNVKMQTMAIFTETAPGSSKSGWKQAEVFNSLFRLYQNDFEIISHSSQLDLSRRSSQIGIIPAIENASGFCEEDASLENALEQLNILQHKVGKVAYISLTWNTENRFGGGALTKVGLKNDGKRLIDYMAERRIPLDFSHASDYLAFDMLNYIDKNNIKLPTLASHSNLRVVTDHPRNLPTDLAKEIIRREGLIGLNFYRRFVGGHSPENFVKHLEHLLSWGGENQVCFGADFFHNEDLSPEYRTSPQDSFFPSYDHAGTYGNVINLWVKSLNLSDLVLKKICQENLMRFLRDHLFNCKE